VTSQPFNRGRTFQDERPGTPIFVFLSPGVDVAGRVEALGRKLGFTAENGRYFSVSLGQGQASLVEQCRAAGPPPALVLVTFHTRPL